MITRAFGREERSFILKCRGWREVEKACDTGLGEIAARLAPLVRLVQGAPPTIPAADRRHRCRRSRLRPAR
jgi:hypothetical protein